LASKFLITPVSSQRRSLVTYLLSTVIVGFLLFLIAGCQAEATTVSDLPSSTEQTIQEKMAMPPAVMVTIAAPGEQQSFKPLSAADIAATATSSALSSIAEEVASNSPVGSSSDGVVPTSTVALPTMTPLPTFTPPALPKTSPWEHYWLHRPVPEGGTVWTDKAYPYGSSRGGTLRTHHGVEFNVPRGTQVLSAASGTVVVAGDDLEVQLGALPNFYGNVVVIEHDTALDGEPVYSLYGHLSQIIVNEGQHVQAQEVIARSGASGVADGPHLHFEVRVGENSYEHSRNPLLWLYPFPDRAVVAGLITRTDGSPARDVPVTLRRVDAPSPYAATTTYSDDSVNSDEKWLENFAFDDVAAGYYELSVGTGKEKIKAEFWVYSYQTAFVAIALEE
jgi:murein DD-endopeptidase MepM/ murein hydrolase activator NlpD